jgi:hypothetical protein
MGVLCDVYIADPERAPKYDFRGKCKCKDLQSCKCWDQFAFETYDRVDSHRIYDRDFAKLLSVLRGKRHRDSVIKEFEMIKESDGGPWIQKVPNDLPKLLAEATIKELGTINESWVELMNDGQPFPIEDNLALDYLKLLQKLCKKSVIKEQSMYLWTSL